MSVHKVVDVLFMLIIVIVLTALVWIFLESIADAQGGRFWYLTTHYRWQWHNGRWVRVTYPVVCSGYICKPACRTLYGGWGPCR